MLKHRGKEKIKVSFDIVVRKASNLDKSLNGTTVYIEWRRGSKRATGMTKRALVTKNEAVWSEPINCTCTMFHDSRTDKYDEKSISFYLKEVCQLP